MENIENKGNFKGFFKKIGFIISIAVLVIIIGLSVFWKYLECYQKSIPTAPIKEFFGYIENGDYEAALSISDPEHKMFENADELKQFSELNFGSDFSDMKFLKASAENESGNTDYSAYAGDKKLMKVSVSKSEDSVGFGLKKYKITSLLLDYIDDISVTVPKGSKVYVNGEVLEESTATEKYQNDLFIGISDEQCPVMMNYTLSEYILYPEIAVTFNEKLCTATQSSDDYNMIFGLEISDEESTQLSTFATDACKAYASFITRDGTLNNLLRYIYRESSFYDDMRGYENQWYGYHSGMTYSEEKIDEILKFDETHISVTISMKQSMRIAGENTVTDLKYTAAIMLVENEWKVINIVSK